jgi:hypothetical protein
MKLDDMILVSIDDHVIEPADMFEHHMPAKYAAQAPRIVVSETGVEQWEFQGSVAGTIALNAVVGWPKEDWGFDPVTFAEMRPMLVGSWIEQRRPISSYRPPPYCELS